jgi:hypothetical protein
LWKNHNLDPSTKTEYDEKQFEMIEKIKSMVVIKKTIKQKEQIEQPESEVRKSLVVKK